MNPDMAGPSQTANPEFSLVVSCYFEERTIEEFHRRALAALEATGRSFEIILVNDGSADGTWNKLEAIFERDPRVRAVLDLFANAGQQAAVTAGLQEARGDAIILLDSDLQLAPEELPRLVEVYDRGYDLVSGYRENRKDSLFRVLPSKLANIIMRRASRSTLRDFGCTFKIYNARLLRAFQFGAHHVFSNVDVISRITRYTETPVTHFPRPHGKSGWTFRKLWTYNMENLVKLSQTPFQWLALACILASLVFFLRIGAGFFSGFGILRQVTPGLLLNVQVAAVLLLLAVLALIGEFTIRSFLSLRKTPAYIVRARRARDEAPAARP